MNRKDMMFTVILGMVPFGLSHLYVGQKKKALYILIIQLLNLILAGVSMMFISFGPQLFYIAFFGVMIWSIYDSVAEAKWINEEIDRFY